jgi:hypothetical protein
MLRLNSRSLDVGDDCCRRPPLLRTPECRLRGSYFARWGCAVGCAIERALPGCWHLIEVSARWRRYRYQQASPVPSRGLPVREHFSLDAGIYLTDGSGSERSLEVVPQRASLTRKSGVPSREHYLSCIQRFLTGRCLRGSFMDRRPQEIYAVAVLMYGNMYGNKRVCSS